MDLIDLLQQDTTAFLIFTGIFSLIIGSFLNAAIYRIPIMMQKEWHQECKELLQEDSNQQESVASKKEETFNLMTPRSTCPSCGHMITALENVPVLSYLFLRGKCSSCKIGISVQYPLIEIFTAVLSIFVAWKFGFTWQTLAALVFAWTLITLSIIDAKTFLLPDNLTLPLMWLGIAVNYNHLFVDLQSSVLGAMIGYLSLWTIFQIFKLVTGKEGMGFGDFKILAALGAWGGWQILPFTIFTASLFGAIFGILWMAIKRDKNANMIPFGPWLASAGFIAFLWRDDITQIMSGYLSP
ncbi:MAG: prepilin peptidase [Cocleimonas sp.]|nr:prepilin peptidase [Cocleimonas sp.]